MVASPVLFGVFLSLSIYNPVVSYPLYDYWEMSLSWALPSLAAIGATFSLDLPCIYDFGSQLDTLSLQANTEDGYREFGHCDLISGKCGSASSQLQCTVVDSPSLSYDCSGLFELPIYFNVGTTGSAVDIQCSNQFHQGTNTISFSDGQDSVSCSVDFEARSIGWGYYGEICYSHGDNSDSSVQTVEAVLIAPSCPDGYSMVTLEMYGDAEEYTLDADSVIVSTTSGLNDWGMPTSSDDTGLVLQGRTFGFSTTTRSGGVIAQIYNVPPGYRPYLSALGQATSFNQIYWDFTAECADPNQSLTVEGPIPTVTTTMTWTGTATQTSTITFGPTASVIVEVPYVPVHRFGIFTSLSISNLENGNSPLDSGWQINLEGQLPDLLQPGDYFTLDLPGVYDFLQTDPVTLYFDLQKRHDYEPARDAVKCELIAGKYLSVSSRLACTVINTLPYSTTFSSVVIPFVFNVGTTDSAIDLQCASMFEVGVNTITFSDGQTDISTEVTFEASQSSVGDSSTYTTYSHGDDSGGGNPISLINEIAGFCPFGYTSVTLGWSFTDYDVECSTLDATVTYGLNAWGMPLSSADTVPLPSSSIMLTSVTCAGKSILVIFADVPAGYTPYISGQTTALIDETPEFEFEYVCANPSVTETWTGSDVETSTLHDDGGLTTNVVKVPVPTTTLTSTWTGSDTEIVTVSADAGATGTVIIEVPVPTVTTTLTWTGSDTETTTVTAIVGSTASVIIQVPSSVSSISANSSTSVISSSTSSSTLSSASTSFSPSSTSSVISFSTSASSSASVVSSSSSTSLSSSQVNSSSTLSSSILSSNSISGSSFSSTSPSSSLVVNSSTSVSSNEVGTTSSSSSSTSTILMSSVSVASGSSSLSSQRPWNSSLTISSGAPITSSSSLNSVSVSAISSTGAPLTSSSPATSAITTTGSPAPGIRSSGSLTTGSAAPAIRSSGSLTTMTVVVSGVTTTYTTTCPEGIKPTQSVVSTISRSASSTIVTVVVSGVTSTYTTVCPEGKSKSNIPVATSGTASVLEVFSTSSSAPIRATASASLTKSSGSEQISSNSIASVGTISTKAQAQITSQSSSSSIGSYAVSTYQQAAQFLRTSNIAMGIAILISFII